MLKKPYSKAYLFLQLRILLPALLKFEYSLIKKIEREKITIKRNSTPKFVKIKNKGLLFTFTY
jgi:hypothetical protein